MGYRGVATFNGVPGVPQKHEKLSDSRTRWTAISRREGDVCAVAQAIGGCIGTRVMSMGQSGLFGPEYVQQFLAAAMPQLEPLIRKIVAEQEGATEILCVDYEHAGKMIDTTYEGIRKLVRKGKLTPVGNGRRRKIAVAELKAYIERNRVKKQ